MPSSCSPYNRTIRGALCAVLSASFCTLLGSVHEAHAQRLNTVRPAATGADNVGSLALVTPLGGRISPLLTALYQNYIALHPTRLNPATGLQTGAVTQALNAATNPAPAGVDYAAQSKVGDTPIRSTANSVLINLNVTGNVAATRKRLEALGMVVKGEFDIYLGGTIPISAIGQLSQMSSVGYADVDYGCKVNTGSTTTQGDVVQRSALARSAYKFTGLNKKVGVISDSFNTSGNGSYAADKDSGDLPALSASNTSKSGLTVLDEYNGNGSDEGRAMMQIVSDVAPDAGLAFASAFNDYIQFAQNIGRLRSDAACDVIVDDVFYYNEPFFMDGPLNQAIDNVVAAGSSYFSAAGNNAQKSYESTFRPSGTTATIGGVTYQLHNFNGGAGAADVYQRITLPVGFEFGCSFQWDEPFRSVAPASTGAVTDLDIFLYNKTDGAIVARGSTTNVGSNPNDPFEYFQYINPGTVDADGDGTPDTEFDIVLARRTSTTGTPYMKYVDFGNSITINEYDTKSGTAVGHPNAASCEAIGAARWYQTPDYGYLPPLLEYFSSSGGVGIRRDKAGNAIGVKLRNTPDIVAPDGGNTTFFGQNFDGPYQADDGYPNFFGTSAAAPHAAGVAALMLEANASATPTQIYRSLERTALDMGATQGYDYDTGYGFINANLAVKDIMTASSATTGAIISEFRERGNNSSNSAGDEYVELYNPTSSPLNISGWKLQYTGTVSETAATQTLTIAANTTIPAYGHYLIVGAGYSLANYGGTGAAAGNQTLSVAIDDGSPLTLLNAASVAQDAVTFGSNTGGLSTAPTTVGQYAFVRQYDPLTGLPITGANSFVFVDVNATGYTGTTNSNNTKGGANTLTAVLGAPGPKNLGSPIVNPAIKVTLLDPTLGSSVTPNRVRNTGATGTNATNGTISFRRLITNNTGAAITKLRFRIINLTTLNSPGYTNTTQADMRVIASPSATQSITVNSQNVTVYGTTPDATIAQSLGGGVNSSSVETSSGVVTLSATIPSGQKRAYDFTFGLERTGNFVFALVLESTTS